MLKNKIPTIKVKIGVSELIMPASALLIFISARGKSIAGIPLPRKPDAAKYFQLVLFSIEKCLTMNGIIAMKAMKILNAPIWYGV
jgi:hypothetical protein